VVINVNHQVEKAIIITLPLVNLVGLVDLVDLVKLVGLVDWVIAPIITKNLLVVVVTTITVMLLIVTVTFPLHLLHLFQTSN
jgi:hypothetical protein